VSGPAPIEVRVKLTFPESLIRVPVLARLTRRFDVDPNIRRANVDDHEGWIICELVGAAEAIEAAVEWLREEGVGVDLLGDVLEG
jgi:ABC-type methionine transport system ATPase subunit